MACGGQPDTAVISAVIATAFSPFPRRARTMPGHGPTHPIPTKREHSRGLDFEEIILFAYRYARYDTMSISVEEVGSVGCWYHLPVHLTIIYLPSGSSSSMELLLGLPKYLYFERGAVAVPLHNVYKGCKSGACIPV